MALMRGLAVSLVGLGLAAGAAPAGDEAHMMEIGAVLKAHDEALNAHDVDAVLATYADHEGIMLMGTGPGEFWRGREAIAAAYERYIEDFDKGTMSANCPWKDGYVEEDGNSGWFVGSCVIGESKGDEIREYVLNVSAFVAKDDGAWKLHVLHVSNLTGSE